MVLHITDTLKWRRTKHRDDNNA